MLLSLKLTNFQLKEERRLKRFYALVCALIGIKVMLKGHLGLPFLDTSKVSAVRNAAINAVLRYEMWQLPTWYNDREDCSISATSTLTSPTENLSRVAQALIHKEIRFLG
jgi:hypothetical protein